MLLFLLAPIALSAPNPERMLQDDRELSSGFFDATVELGFLIWRNGISPGDGPRCPLRPSCSLYARQAVSRDGVAAFPMVFDRLLRDSNAAAYEVAPDGVHALDPLHDHAPALQLLSGAHCRRQRAEHPDAACL